MMEEGELLDALHKEKFYCSYVFYRDKTQKETILKNPAFLSAAMHPSGENCFCITNAGTDKGTGIRRLAEHWDIPFEAILAVGNEENDVPMFKAAGISVAVENATPEALSAAEWIVPDVRHAGAAEAIRRFALQGYMTE